MVQVVKEQNYQTDYSSVDLNATGTTTLLNPSNRQHKVYGVYLRNGGTSAVVNLELTDGSSTATLADNRGSGGANIAFGDTIVIPSGETLQVNVTTAEGSAQSNTAVVTHGQQGHEPTG